VGIKGTHEKKQQKDDGGWGCIRADEKGGKKGGQVGETSGNLKYWEKGGGKLPKKGRSLGKRQSRGKRGEKNGGEFKENEEG